MALCLHLVLAYTGPGVSILGQGVMTPAPWKYAGGVRVGFDFDPLKMSHSFIQNCCCVTASFITSRMNTWTLSLHWSCLCWQCYHTTILIDDVPAEGIEEFIYLGSKQSSNIYCRPVVLRRIRLACSVMNSLQRVWNCSSLSISTNVQMYQALICLFWSKVQKHRPSWSPTWIHWRLSTWGVSDRYLMYAGGFMSPMQRCFSDLVCQPLVTFYIDAYLCLAMLHTWTLKYQHMMLCV